MIKRFFFNLPSSLTQRYIRSQKETHVNLVATTSKDNVLHYLFTIKETEILNLNSFLGVFFITYTESLEPTLAIFFVRMKIV